MFLLSKSGYPDQVVLKACPGKQRGTQILLPWGGARPEQSRDLGSGRGQGRLSRERIRKLGLQETELYFENKSKGYFPRELSSARPREGRVGEIPPPRL